MSEAALGTWDFAGNGIFGDFFTSFENCVIRQDDVEYKLGTKKAPLTKEAWNKLLSAMNDKKLSFDVTEEIDGEEGARWKQTTNFSSKGKRLLYKQTEMEEIPLEGYSKAEELIGVFEYKVKLIVGKNTCGHRYAVKNRIKFKLK